MELMKKIEVFDGRLLHDKPVPYPVGPVKCTLRGDGSSAGQVINLDENLLSRHIMLLGGIGTGKTNTINQLLNQLLNNLTTEDIVIIFDTKGDFYREFYSPEMLLSAMTVQLLVRTARTTGISIMKLSTMSIWKKISSKLQMRSSEKKSKKQISRSFQMQLKIFFQLYWRILSTTEKKTS